MDVFSRTGFLYAMSSLCVVVSEVFLRAPFYNFRVFLGVLYLASIGSADVQKPEASFVNGFIYLTFYPLPLTLYLGTETVGYVNLTVGNHTYQDHSKMRLHVCCIDQQISKIADDSKYHDISMEQPGWVVFNITVKAARLGRTIIRFYITRNVSKQTKQEDSGKVIHNKKRTNKDERVILIDKMQRNQRKNGYLEKLEIQNPSKFTSGMAKKNYRDKLNQSHTKETQWQRAVLTPTPLHKVLLYNRSGQSASKVDYRRLGDGPHPGDNGRPEPDSNAARSHVSNNTAANDDGDNDDDIVQWWLLGVYDVVVIRRDNWLEKWLDFAVMVLIAINMVGIGGQIDEVEMLHAIKKPVALSVGLFCRFGIMPALGLGLVELIKPDFQDSLGVLSFLCSPHEGASSLLVLLADKDLTFSVTLIIIINFTAVAFLPLWTIVFETRIYDDPGRANIPFREMFVVFGYILISIAVGYGLQKKCPKCYRKLWMFMPVVTALTVLFIISVEIYKSEFVFELITAKVFFLSAMLAVAGYIFGCAVAFVARQPISRIIVLSIETGCRTTYTTILLLNMSLEKPERDIARTTPVLGGLLTLFPGLVAVVIHRVYTVTKGGDSSRAECRAGDTKARHLADDSGSFSEEDSIEGLMAIRETAM